MCISSLVGKIILSANGEKWTHYVDQLECYFLAKVM